MEHGRLIAAGLESGADELDTYDVACLMWAFLDDAATTNGTMVGRNHAKSAEVKKSITSMQDRLGDMQGEVDEFRALLNRPAVTEPEGAAQSAGDLDAMRAATSTRIRSDESPDP